MNRKLWVGYHLGNLGYKMLLHSFSNDCWNINFYWTKIGFILLRNLREAPTKKLRYYLGKFYQMCEPTHPPQGFCEIWENKRCNSGQKRQFSGWFGGGGFRGWTLFGNQPPHPPTFGKTFPNKTVNFVGGPSLRRMVIFWVHERFKALKDSRLIEVALFLKEWSRHWFQNFILFRCKAIQRAGLSKWFRCKKTCCYGIIGNQKLLE